MPAKRYAPSHIGSVASTFTTMRISGAVKESLVGLVCSELDSLVPSMEQATLENDPERKTLDDSNRTRLNYNRTRELMIDRLEQVESVGSAAVQGGIEYIEKFLARLMRNCEEAASRDRVSTIKPRHLQLAIRGDEELDTLIKATIAGGGVIPHIHKALIMKSAKKNPK